MLVTVRGLKVNPSLLGEGKSSQKNFVFVLRSLALN